MTISPFGARRRGVRLLRNGVAAGLALGLLASVQYLAASTGRAELPRLLSQTGLYAAGAGTTAIDPQNRPFSPQYPLWSDGAGKSRWVRLPAGATIDVLDVDRWDFPVGTRFWKEFTFGGRKVETRFLRKDGPASWSFASYVWNEEQTDAELAPEGGVMNVAEVAPGRRHTIPSVEDCRACHDSARTEILGFTALQLSTDRDPNAPHAEPLTPGMVTLKTLVEERLITPARPELLDAPPRVAAPDPRTRAVLGYLSTNCGACHNAESSLASLGLLLKARLEPSHAPHHDPVKKLFKPTAKWQIPEAPDGASAFVTPGAPDLSALLVRMRSRRPSTQMPPLGTVLHDREAIDLVTAWIEDLGRR
ncbi:MAG TPA: hypothetical protein VIK60_12570 [Vicinamibacterales bacterium]